MRTNRNPHVPEVEGIDLDFVPAGYFLARDLRLMLPSDIQGQARRDIARTLVAEGRELPPELAAPVLDEDDRRAWGLIHPSMMGGEYLPAMAVDEVEIVRISLASVTADQVSVRARRRGARIAYSIVDEYDGAGVYDLHPRTSARPLSMGQLIAMLDGACDHGGAVLSPVVWHVEEGGSVDSMRHSVTVESDFYADLGEYYRVRFERYFQSVEEPSEDDA